jgi:hypothetical protein
MRKITTFSCLFFFRNKNILERFARTIEDEITQVSPNANELDLQVYAQILGCFQEMAAYEPFAQRHQSPTVQLIVAEDIYAPDELWDLPEEAQSRLLQRGGPKTISVEMILARSKTAGEIVQQATETLRQAAMPPNIRMFESLTALLQAAPFQESETPGEQLEKPGHDLDIVLLQEDVALHLYAFLLHWTAGIAGGVADAFTKLVRAEESRATAVHARLYAACCSLLAADPRIVLHLAITLRKTKSLGALEATLESAEFLKTLLTRQPASAEAQALSQACDDLLNWFRQKPVQRKKALTLIPARIPQQTSMEFRSFSSALADTPSLRRWHDIEAEVALRHIVDGCDLQVVICAGNALQWLGLPTTHEALREEVRQLGLDGIFLMHILAHLALAEDRVEISLDELIRAIGKEAEARKSREHRARLRRWVWRALLLFENLATVGRRKGVYRDRDTNEALDLATTSVDAILRITGYDLADPFSPDKSSPPVVVRYTIGPWLEKVRGDRRILTTFGNLRKLAALPSGKAAAAWAKSIGLGLHQRWREGAYDADVYAVGDNNKPTAKFKRAITRRDLLLGEVLPRAYPDPEAILNSEMPGRARDYCNKAIGILKEMGIIGFYREEGTLQKMREGWQQEWLDQPLDIRPKSEGIEDIAKISRSRANAKKKGGSRKQSGGNKP